MCQKLFEFLIKCIVCNALTHLPVICLWQPTIYLYIYYSLENAINNLFLHSQLNYRHCLLTVDCNTAAIFKTSEGYFTICDSHSRDSYGIPHPFGKYVQISVENINNLLIYLQNTVAWGNVTPFEVKGPERGNCSINKFWHNPNRHAYFVRRKCKRMCDTHTRLSNTYRVAEYSLDPRRGMPGKRTCEIF